MLATASTHNPGNTACAMTANASASPATFRYTVAAVSAHGTTRSHRAGISNHASTIPAAENTKIPKSIPTGTAAASTGPNDGSAAAETRANDTTNPTNPSNPTAATITAAA